MKTSQLVIHPPLLTRVVYRVRVSVYLNVRDIMLNKNIGKTN